MSVSLRAFGLAAALNLGFVAFEFAAGRWAHSAALVADSGHNLIDGLGLLASGAALWLGRLPPTLSYTFGLKTASSLAALANAAALAVVVILIALDAVGRLAAPPPSAGLIVLAVASAAALVNGVCALMIGGGGRELNGRAAFLHMLGDMMISAAVALSGLIVWRTGWLWVDPAASLALSVVLAYAAAKVLGEALHLALAGVPPHIDAEAVRGLLASLPGVVDVHDLRIWPVGTDEAALTCHLVMPGGHPGDAFILETEARLDAAFGIRHTTLQVEIADAPSGALVAA